MHVPLQQTLEQAETFHPSSPRKATRTERPRTIGDSTYQGSRSPRRAANRDAGGGSAIGAPALGRRRERQPRPKAATSVWESFGCRESGQFLSIAWSQSDEKHGPAHAA